MQTRRNGGERGRRTSGPLHSSSAHLSTLRLSKPLAVIYKCDKTEDADSQAVVEAGADEAEEDADQLTKDVKCTKIKDEDDCDDEDE